MTSSDTKIPEKKQRTPRRSQEQIRELLLDAGLTLIEREGVTSAVAGLTFKRVLAEVETRSGVVLHHASIIGRSYADQEAFQRDLLARLVQRINEIELDDVVSAVRDVLAQARLDSPEERLSALIEIDRVGSLAHERTMRAVPLWSAWIAAVAAEGDRNRPDFSPETFEQLAETVRAETRAFAALFRAIFDHLGFRARSPHTVEDLTVAISALAEGVLVRGRVAPELFAPRPVAVDPRVEAREWSILGLGIRALSAAMAEPIPNWSPSSVN